LLVANAEPKHSPMQTVEITKQLEYDQMDIDQIKFLHKKYGDNFNSFIEYVKSIKLE
jgi:hypothetical protein